MPKAYQTNLSEKNKLIYDRKDGLFIQFPVATPATTYTKGQIVTLTATGEVEVCTAGDVPLGYVSVANIPNDPSGPIHHADHVTVGTFCQDGVYGYAKGGTLPIGAVVQADGQNPGDPTLMDYSLATTGSLVVGVVVKGGAATEEVTVLLYNSFFVLT